MTATIESVAFVVVVSFLAVLVMAASSVVQLGRHLWQVRHRATRRDPVIGTDQHREARRAHLRRWQDQTRED